MYAQQGGVREHRFFLRMAENQAGTNRPAGLCRHARARRDIPAMTRYLRRSYQSAYLSAISASSCPYQSSDTVSFVVMSCSDRLAFSIASLPHLTLHSLHHTEVPIALTSSRDPTSRRHSEGVRLGTEASQLLHVLDELG